MTPDEINALPEPVRQYIQTLEIRQSRHSACQCGHFPSAHDGHAHRLGSPEPDHCAHCECRHYEAALNLECRNHAEVIEGLVKERDYWLDDRNRQVAALVKERDELLSAAAYWMGAVQEAIGVDSSSNNCNFCRANRRHKSDCQWIIAQTTNTSPVPE